MKILMTGATGFVGSAVLRALEARQHDVTAVVRTADDAAKLEAKGHSALTLDLTDLAGLRNAARDMHGAVHCAASDNPEFWPTSEAAALAIMEGLPDGAAFASHGGTILFGPTGEQPEAPVEFSPPPPLLRRAQVDEAIERNAGERVTTILAYGAFVYGGAGAALPGLMRAVADNAGAACYPQDGSAIWSTVHIDDFGALLVDGIEKAKSGHHRVFAADAPMSMRAIAESIGRALSVPTRSVEGAEAQEIFGFFANALTANQCFSARPAQDLCGWRATNSSLRAFESSLRP